jgi:hypothetical protein
VAAIRSPAKSVISEHDSYCVLAPDETEAADSLEMVSEKTCAAAGKARVRESVYKRNLDCRLAEAGNHQQTVRVFKPLLEAPVTKSDRDKRTFRAPVVMGHPNQHLRIAQAIGRRFFTVERFYGTEAKAAHEQRDRAEIAHRLRNVGLGIRGRACQVHEERVLRGVFASFATELKATLGFDIEDVIVCFEAIPNTVMQGFNRLQEAYSGGEDPESIHHRTALPVLRCGRAGC